MLTRIVARWFAFFVVKSTDKIVGLTLLFFATHLIFGAQTAK